MAHKYDHKFHVFFYRTSDSAKTPSGDYFFVEQFLA